MSKKVLIAEDSSVIQNLTKRILQFQNFEIVTAKNGKQVMDILDKDSIDIILMDINMPVMDGIECCQKVRSSSDEKISKTPIFAITGNAQNHSVDYLKSVGFNEYLQKPLNFDQLVDMVKQYTA